MEQNKKSIPVIMDFSGIYQTEEFWKERDVQWIFVSDLTGTNCYCDDEARRLIRERIGMADIHGIHFLDSGNYHYMSAVWLEKIKEPFRLLVLDNHTDMQLPAFGGILSCGGWIADVLENHPYLEEVILIGPDEEAFRQTDDSFKNRTSFYSREQLKNGGMEELSCFLGRIPADLPLYISVDKDVLCPQDADTTWSQGDMRLEELERILKVVYEHFYNKNGEIIGMDICGECDFEHPAGSSINVRANERLLKLYETWSGL